jgi:hypothetical protein
MVASRLWTALTRLELDSIMTNLDSDGASGHLHTKVDTFQTTRLIFEALEPA